jgi:hypothetical protein
MNCGEYTAVAGILNRLPLAGGDAERFLAKQNIPVRL